MRKPIELNYIEKNGLLYPNLQISNDKADDEQPVGKYGMMWLKFMQEWHYNRFIEWRMDGNLLAMAHNINNEAFEMIKFQTGSNNNIDKLIMEDNIIKEFVLVCR